MTYKKFEFFLLLTLIVFSKEILVFNEEILVLLSFIVFSFLFYNFTRDTICIELNLRSNKIKEEFDFYEETRKKTLIHIISYYSKQKLLSHKIKYISTSIEENIKFILFNSFILHTKLLNSNINDKLLRLILNESKVILLIQKKINSQLFIFLTTNLIKNRLKYKQKFKKFLLSLVLSLSLLTSR